MPMSSLPLLVYTLWSPELWDSRETRPHRTEAAGGSSQAVPERGPSPLSLSKKDQWQVG